MKFFNASIILTALIVGSSHSSAVNQPKGNGVASYSQMLDATVSGLVKRAQQFTQAVSEASRAAQNYLQTLSTSDFARDYENKSIIEQAAFHLGYTYALAVVTLALSTMISPGLTGQTARLGTILAGAATLFSGTKTIGHSLASLTEKNAQSAE